jgi:hypothetical protein
MATKKGGKKAAKKAAPKKRGTIFPRPRYTGTEGTLPTKPGKKK